MQNEWFFKWHFIGSDGPIEIDAFDGRTLRYSFVEFGGTTQLVYWETIERYMRQKLAAIFDGLEEELLRYPIGVRKVSIVQVVPVIRSFADAIRRETVEKDRILRGNGMEFPKPYDRGKWVGARAGEIERRAAMLDEIYGMPVAEEANAAMYVVNHIHGVNARVNIRSTDSSTNISAGVSGEQLAAFLVQLSTHKAGLPVPLLEAVTRLVMELEDESTKPAISQSKVKAALISLKTITEGAAGNLVASGITGLIVSMLANL